MAKFKPILMTGVIAIVAIIVYRMIQARVPALPQV